MIRKILSGVLFCLLITGCATYEGLKTDMSELFKSKPKMVYYSEYEETYLKPIKEKIDKVNKADMIILTSTGIGVGVGAAVGAIASKGDATKTAVGAVAGGVVGYSYGYVQAKKLLMSNNDERFSFYETDVKDNNKDYEELIKLEEKALVAFNNEFNKLEKNKDTYSEEEFTARYNELVYGIDFIRSSYDDSVKALDQVINVSKDIPSEEKKLISEDLKENKITSTEYDERNKTIKELDKKLKKQTKELEKTKEKNKKLEEKLMAYERKIKSLEEENAVLQG